MIAKPLQLTVAILAGALLGVFATHLLLRRDAAQPSPSPATANLQPKTDSPPAAPPAVPPLRSQVSALIPHLTSPNNSATFAISSFTETRSQITSPSASSPQFAGLRLELVFSGELVNRSLKYGNLQITKAVDDAGNDLIIKRAERPGGFVTNALPGLRPIETPRMSQAGAANSQAGTPVSPAGTPVLPFPLLRSAGTKTDSALHRSAATPADASGNARATNPLESAPSAPSAVPQESEIQNPNSASSASSAVPQKSEIPNPPSAPSASSAVKETASAEPKTQNQKPSATPQTVRLLIHLKTPPRTSTALKELEGTLQFLQTSGTLELKTPAIKTLEGKPIETPELQAARVSIGVQPARKSSFVTDPARAVTLRISGLKDAVLRVVFLDKDGKPLRTSNSWYSPSPGIEDWSYVFDRAVSEDVTLQLTLAREAKLVDVPFRVSNLALP